MKQLLIILAALSLYACGGGRTASSPQAEGDTVPFKYARLLTVVRYDGYTVATIKNPWSPGKALHRYVLVPNGSLCSGAAAAPAEKGTLLRTPLSRSMIFTTVHCAMLQSLGREDCITGVADLKYIKIPWVHQQVAAGRIVDVGEGMSPVIEKIIDRRPDAILLSPFENSGGYGKLEDIDIPIVECAEYMEESPLARAEWLRFYGMLFGCEHEADSLFAVVDSSYQALSRQAREAKDQPTVIVDKVTGSVWYVPGGRSTIGRMIADAGGRYLWADDTHSGSVSLPFEAVLERAGEADVWLFRYSADHDITYGELAAEHHGYPQFKAFRRRAAYGCNVELSLFYEESPFRPDWLLSDFIQILHPDITNLPPLRYYQKVGNPEINRKL